MAVWTCNDFEGLYPVGTAAVVVADTEDQARQLLDDELTQRSLKQLQSYRLVRLDLTTPHVVLLADGDY
jgi:hypothetical protein